jgi:tartrate dehydrogenase/decarboxylase/D-malate dehydrogenase
MQRLRIAVYPGDGIGPEVIDQTLRVLDAAATLESTSPSAAGAFSLSYDRLPWGVDYWERTGGPAMRSCSERSVGQQRSPTT